MTAVEVITGLLAPVGGRRLLELGAGGGGLGRALTKRGMHWTGVDPGAVRPGVLRAGAEALPFGSAQFDCAVFLNALHHVPVAQMGRALTEVRRVLTPGSDLVIIEPLASGPLSQVLAVVDDETRIRAAAQDAIDVALAHSIFNLGKAFTYTHTGNYPDFDSFAAGIAKADPARADALRENRAEMLARFVALAERTPQGFALAQPMQVHHLTC